MVCPEVLGLLARLYAAIDTPAESRVLDSIYRWMPPRNVSSQLLQKIPEHIALVELRGVHWCDWGRPERIVESLQRIGKAPSFPLRCLANEAERDVQTEAPAK